MKCMNDEIFYTGDVVKLERVTKIVKSMAQEVTIIDFEKAA